MGFRTEHLNTTELADIRRGERPDLAELVHLAECASCKKQFADSLILRQLIRDAGVSAALGPHPSVREIDRFHASAYEAAETNPDEFLDIDRHLQKCDACFAKFLSIHERLSPSKHLVGRVVKQAAALSRNDLGTLVLQRALDSISLVLRPAKRARSSEAFSERTLKDLLRIVQPASPSLSQDVLGNPEMSVPLLSMSRSPEESLDGVLDADIRSAYGLDANPEMSSDLGIDAGPQPEPLGALRTENMGLVIQRMPDPKRVLLVFHAIEVESGKSIEGAEVTEIDAEGIVIASGKTDASGKAQLELISTGERFRVATGKGAEPWEIRVEHKQEFFRTSRARARAEEEVALREARAKGVEERTVRREATAATKRERIAKFRTLSPEEQVASAASDDTNPVFFYQTLLPALTPELLSGIEPEILRKLGTKLAKVQRGPLASARKVLEEYLARQSGGGK